MNIRNSMVGGLAGIVLGSGLYFTPAHADPLMVQVGSLYVTCDTDETYAANNVCYAPVNAYNAAIAVKKKSSSSPSPSARSSSDSSPRLGHEAYRLLRPAAEKRGHYVCPKR